MGHNDAAQRARIRKAVLRHARRYPLAADTVEGIVMRWLPRAGFECAPDHIDRVLATLVADGLLQTRLLPDGNILFRVRGNAAGPPHDDAKPRSGRSRR